MSYHDYSVSLDIYIKGYPFDALIMAAMRQADSDNALRLKQSFWWIWDELKARYDSPEGRIEGDTDKEVLGYWCVGEDVALDTDENWDESHD